MIRKKLISIRHSIKPKKPYLQKRFRFLKDALEHVPHYFAETMKTTPDFRPLPAPDRNIYVCGSGASAMQAQFLADLFQKYLGLPAIFSHPFSLKSGSMPKKGETVIFFSQKLSSPIREAIEHYRDRGIHVIVFTACENDEMPVDVQTYKFLPAHTYRRGEQMIVPVIGPITSYLQIIRYVHYLTSSHGIETHDNFDLKIQETLNEITNASDKFRHIRKSLRGNSLDIPVVVIGSGLNMVAAQHMAQTLTEGALIQAHAHEMENYTHGLRFYDRDEPRLFVILKNSDNSAYYDAVYSKSIFTEGHIVLELTASLPEPFRIFEYEMLGYYLLQYLIQQKDIDIRNYPGKFDQRTRGIHKTPY